VIRALLLDFDGLLYDTESSAYGAWEQLYAERGVHLSLRTWVGEVIGRPPGSSGFDPLAELERLTGERFDRDAVLAERDARRAVMLPHHLMRGAEALLAGARDAGLETAIVTSNSLVNVQRHLARLPNRPAKNQQTYADRNCHAKACSLCNKFNERRMLETSSAAVVKEQRAGL